MKEVENMDNVIVIHPKVEVEDNIRLIDGKIKEIKKLILQTINKLRKKDKRK